MSFSIISHRGFWRADEEKNSLDAFRRSFYSGYGVETDLRDYGSKIVISHDPPQNLNITFEDFLDTYVAYSNSPVLALNIKADGLCNEINRLITQYGVSNYFVFDMAVPDGLAYLKNGMQTFTRQSDFELVPAFYEKASGVWLDEFNSHWINENTVTEHLNNNKKVCIVSPELHNRSYKSEWKIYKEMLKNLDSENLMLCTDFPHEAKEYFYG